MNFNSFPFLLLFLPVTLLGFYLINRIERCKWPIVWLVGASLIFYGFWSLVLAGVLIGSVLTNYVLGRFFNSSQINKVNLKKILYFGIVCNLGVLIYFNNSVFMEVRNCKNFLLLTHGVSSSRLGYPFLPFSK